MTGPLLGMDTESARSTAQSIRAVATRLRAFEVSTDALVRDVRACWRGSVAEAFVAQWDTTGRATIRRMVDDVVDLADRLFMQATQQDRTSDPDLGYGDGPVCLTPERDVILHRANTPDDVSKAAADVRLDGVEGDVYQIRGDDGQPLLVMYHAPKDGPDKGWEPDESTSVATFKEHLAKQGKPFATFDDWADELAKHPHLRGIVDVKNMGAAKRVAEVMDAKGIDNDRLEYFVFIAWTAAVGGSIAGINHIRKDRKNAKIRYVFHEGSKDFGPKWLQTRYEYAFLRQQGIDAHANYKAIPSMQHMVDGGHLSVGQSSNLEDGRVDNHGVPYDMLLVDWGSRDEADEAVRAA